jgi:(1->4)-alpha-D-glucan 1-alpha-D-glucosylmutase
MTKAVREAKVQSSWINVNAEYESALAGFIDAMLGRLQGNRFLDEFVPFQRMVSWLGMLNSLSQTLIKLTSPGVPDIYQGNELWDFSLVDPDNRRAVDYALRTRLLAELEQRVAASGSDWSGVARSAMQTPEDGRAKLFVTWRALRLRSEQRELFCDGDYRPLLATGARKENVVAYARRSETAGAIVVAGRLFAKLVVEPGCVPLGHAVWGDTAVEDLAVPPGVRLVCELTGRTVCGAEGRLMVGDLFADFPAALLSWRLES